MSKKRKLDQDDIIEISDDEVPFTEELALAKYDDLLSPWESCAIKNQNDLNYYVKFFRDHTNDLRPILEFEMAENGHPKEKLGKFTRVIAKLNEQRYPGMRGFYAGIIGEVIKKSNKWEYFILFDNGRIDYVPPKDVRKVYGNYGWLHVHKNAIDFMKYINQCENHLMTKDALGQRLKVEHDGKWQFATVTSELHSKMFQITYEDSKRSEWLYRGSMRISAVWRLYIQSTKWKNLDTSVTEVFLLSSSDDDNDEDDETIRPNNSIVCTIDNDKRNSDVGPIIEQLKLEKLDLYCKSKPLRRHKCTKNCHPIVRNDLNKYGPLAQPLITGWKRLTKRRVIYITPCGREMNNMYDLRIYLREIDCEIFDVDNFSFDKDFDCLRHCDRVRNENSIISNDISNGLEAIPIRVINPFTYKMPDKFEYVIENKRKLNVPDYIELGREVTSYCECDDNCTDRDACPCWEMTYDGRAFVNESTRIFGYEFKRLQNPLTTGIFECNSKCKCSSKCTNRVAQLPIKHRLELYKTKNCGWGIRALEDIPLGAFICCYYGELMTEAQSDHVSKKHGDSYLAQLSFIETCEDFKNDYMDYEDNNGLNNGNNDDRNLWSPRDKEIPYYPLTESQVETKESVRRFFGKNETTYIIDGKRAGNIGRFFNHSCDPNMFLQNVFINTQDLRFPTLALFALESIKAGTELRWNYNYEIGSVPNLVIYCQCGSSFCNGRLL